MLTQSFLKILMNIVDVQRTFIVGCPRSGTTLLQGMLAAHPQIASFPETHYFNAAFPLNPLRRAVTWPSLNGQRCMRHWLRELGRSDLQPLAMIPWGARSYATGFVDVLDQLTREQGAELWVEKTPEHFRRIRQIEAAIPGVRFIHLVRNGVDVVRSLHQASNQDPRSWHTRWRWLGKGLTWNACISRWNEAVAVATQYLDNPQHAVVIYEELLSHPVGVARALADFLKLSYHENMLYPERAYDHIVIRKEPWKINNALPIGKQGETFAPPLSSSMRIRIESALNVEAYRTLQRHALGMGMT
jgi:hypothetical protein